MRLNKELSLFNFWLAAISKTAIATTTILVVLAAVGSDTFAQTDEGSGDDAILTIGSKAPALDIETWFSDREGEFKQTTEFEPGKIYLIDFWATWAAASHGWMAKYADLQDRYFDDGLQIIRVSDEDEDTVADFLELDVNGDTETIYAEWTLGYCVTTDPDRSVHEDYMVAAQQPQVPVVFIVGRTGLIEWIGSPQTLQKPLKKIIADKWDRDVFGAKVLAVQQLSKMQIEVRELLQQGDAEAALKLIEKMIVDAPDSTTKSKMMKARLDLLLELDGPNLAEAFKDVAEDNANDSLQLNDWAWKIVLREQAGKKLSPELLEIATETAKRGVELRRKEGEDENLGAVLDTHAHLVFLQGDLEKALELQIEATEFSQRSDIMEYFDELQAEKSKREKSKAEAEEAAKADTSDSEAPEAPKETETSEQPRSEEPDSDSEEAESEEASNDSEE